ncbi:MAG TPA: hypothetical protein VG938_17380 [Verrucomicrobiae bacterium]|nr:hypothetical protein [Verrucomicrobiae bacterium]
MKSQIPKSKNWSSSFSLIAAICLATCHPPLVARAQTTVLFPLAQMTGTTNDTTITVRPVNNPVNFHSQIYWLPPAGIQLRTTNGSATTNLIPNDYTITIAGVPGSWRISVSDTNVTINAAEIGNLTTYTFTNSLPGVFQLIAGDNITLSPPTGKGVVTVTTSGGGGGGGGSATNAYQVQAGNNLITVATNQTDFIYTISGVSQTNGYPWGTLYDAAGAARAATNGYPWGSSYDVAGAAHAATNGYPWSTLYDSAGSAIAVTNGYPWGVLYDAAGAAQAATNGLSIASGLAAFRGTNTFAPTNVATASKVGLVKPDGSTITVTSDGTISATTGGGGSVTSVGLSMPGEFSVANSPVTTSGTLAVTRTADANFLGFGATNVGFIRVTNTASIAGQATISTLILTNGITNLALTASTLLKADSNKKVTSIPNATGAITNDGAGNLGYVPLLDASTLAANHHVATGATTNLTSSEDATGYTNTIAWTHDGAATNLTTSFNGALQSFTVTNGPTLFFHFAGANGSCSYRIMTNAALVFDYQPRWLFGSNNVITNGVLSLTSYGGTNATQIEAAIGENQ